jgi:glycerol-1-phosphate dehydrogenase [NAD(P)+]
VVPLLARTIATPVAIEVRPGAVDALAPLLADGRISTGGKVAIVVGPGRGDRIAEALRGSLPEASFVPIDGASMDSAQEVIGRLRADYHDAVVGIGGGQTLDAAKYAASMVGLPYVAVATTLTHDGLASPVATLESYGRKASFGVHTPIAVFVDIDHVRDAPAEHTRSGVGELLSNLSAIADWELARDVRGEPVDGLAVSVARTAAEVILHVDPGTDHFLTLLAEGLIISGIAMAVAGSSRPCSGGCHEISHAMDILLGGPALHGIQVALGARFATWRRGDERLLHDLDEAMLRHGLPRTPGELGLTEEQFAQVLLEAPHTRPDRFTILEHDPIGPSDVQEVVRGFVATVAR